MTRYSATASTSMRPITARQTNLDDVAGRLLINGIQVDDLGLLVIAHAAHARGINNVLVHVMLDEQEPEVVRLRAFAVIAARLGSTLSDEQDLGHAGDPSAASSRELLPA